MRIDKALDHVIDIDIKNHMFDVFLIRGRTDIEGSPLMEILGQFVRAIDAGTPETTLAALDRLRMSREAITSLKEFTHQKYAEAGDMLTKLQNLGDEMIQMYAGLLGLPRRLP